MEERKEKKYVFTIFFILVAAASLFLIKSFAISVIGAILLAYIFYPLYKKLRSIVRSKNLAALLTTIIVVVILIIPVVFAANALLNESLQFFRTVRTAELGGLDQLASKISSDVEIQTYVKDLVTKMSLSVAKGTSDFIFTLPRKILSLFVMLFTMFYLLKEGAELVVNVGKHIPLKESHQANIAKRINSVLYASIFGIVVIAFVQGVLGAIGFWIFDMRSPILWGSVMVVLAMLPLIGTYIVWLPAALYKIYIGDTFNGIGLLLYGTLIVSTIDNIIRPKIVSERGRIHPVFVLLGVLGGLEVFGLLGLILGPIILSVFVVLVEIYVLEKQEAKA